MTNPTDRPVARKDTTDAQAFTSSHTSNFPDLLRELRISLLVSTYQAGKLIIVRAQGSALNTHFCAFESPMGLAYQRETGRLAVGARHEVWTFRNQRDVAAKLPPERTHDAAFLPRRRHYSGDIRIHEIDWIADEVWAVNTRFSCLCTFDREHSFVPRWRPPFITELAPEDRCHLNGLAVVDGQPKWVTCLGLTNTAGGWRENKANGGCLLDVASGEPVLTGLSMPHSPRIRDGKLWLLESGHGAVCSGDAAAGKVETICKLPGFTRGLDFHGRFAFVGLSQVRESATFSGIPLVDAVPERMCGVWVIDTRTGETVSLLRFEGAVQEIFSVQVLPQILFPEVLNTPGETLDSSFILPSGALDQVPQHLRSN
jgi:uncharacterized protein (TIGR03032 family)